MRFILLSLCILAVSTPGFAEIKRRFPSSQVYDELKAWQQSIDSNKELSSSEKRKELNFVSRLKDRLDAEAASEFTVANFKNSLQFLDKNSKKGSNSFYANEAHFISLNLKLVEQLEPTEDPVLVMKNFMRFSGVEKGKADDQALEDFDNSRSYINKDSSMSSDPDELEDAAKLVDEKIFHSPERIDL